MSARSENVEAAERYLAGADCRAEVLGRAASGSESAAPRSRLALVAWAKRCWRRGWEWLAAVRPRSARDARLLSVAERLDLGPKKALVIVACGERRFLVACGAETIAAMLEIGSAKKDLSPLRRRTASPARRRRR
jgi:hypothetical protein